MSLIVMQVLCFWTPYLRGTFLIGFRTVFMPISSILCTNHCLDPLQCLHSRVFAKTWRTQVKWLWQEEMSGWEEDKVRYHRTRSGTIVPGQVPGWCGTSDKGQTNQRFQLVGWVGLGWVECKVGNSVSDLFSVPLVEPGLNKGRSSNELCRRMCLLSFGQFLILLFRLRRQEVETVES